MPNRRLSATLVLLASALLEVALRPRQRLWLHGRSRRPWSWPWPATFALAWLAALATVAAAATSGASDVPPVAPAADGQPLRIACPARMRMSWPGRLLDVPDVEAAAGRPRRADDEPSGSALPAVVASAEAARPPRGKLAAVQALRASFYRGDPRALDVLLPGATHRRGDVETSTWDFPGDAAMPVWIACVYGGDEVLATRPLPAGTRGCTARLRITPMGDPAGLLAVSCR
ncbi:MAG: STY0301 family protein [Burkholderiaceae bacterium]